MPKKYQGEPELSKREKKIKEMDEEIAAERERLKKPFLRQHLKGPFLPRKGRKPAAPRQGGGLKDMDQRELDKEFPNRFTYKPWV